MNAARPPALKATGARHDPAPTAPAPRPANMAPVDSEALLQGQRTIEIRHKGEIYRLQATRLGKLILTK